LQPGVLETSTWAIDDLGLRRSRLHRVSPKTNCSNSRGFVMPFAAAAAALRQRRQEM
jgi:hypothetical protein